jgi:hypothetical protein
MRLLLLVDDLIVGLEVGAVVTSLWKVVKRPGLSSSWGSRVVVDIFHLQSEEKLLIRRDGVLSWCSEVLCGNLHLSNGD